MTLEQQKAKELVDKFGIELASLVVDEILMECQSFKVVFWEQIKQEIINLK